MRDTRILEALIRRERGLSPLCRPDSPIIGWSDRPVSGRFVIPGITPDGDPGLTEAEAWGRADVVWEAPMPSTASRHPSKRSMRSVRGSLVDISRNRVLVFESVLEAFLLQMLISRRNIALIEDQPPAIPFRLDGIWHEHTVDARVTYSDGYREGLVVKPASQLEEDRTPEKVASLKAENLPTFADNIIYLTEFNITRAKGMNATEINSSRKARNQGECNEVLAALQSLRRPVPLWELVASMPNPASVMDAARCLIYDGSVRLHHPGRRMTDASIVSAYWKN
ncbi:hypothetical protein J2045_001940 [Peteryoungia aggregata LMG 23059]|uniref:TnsA endonuclease N-terminal domain-containing protein n=1 Tax=Peteryoungia aggregata LMG 23059 TaxID=1368425 RepID=A0ABU0G6I7_9HYPH|nr:hypothetical protein [Peteryoungia aggregata]MDQ0420913.1 hypothetical protein [Peteryoungia aggregata LMG 23059]